MEQRRTRRFTLQLPLSITRSGAERVAVAGLTKNISSSGVLFTAEREPDLGTPIEYVLTLIEGPQAVSLSCVGKVLRAERIPHSDEGAAFQVAATLERYGFVRTDPIHRPPEAREAAWAPSMRLPCGGLMTPSRSVSDLGKSEKQ